MSKKKKVLTATFAIIAIILIVFLSIFLTSEKRECYKVKKWLSDKYGWSVSEVIIQDYKKGYFTSDIGFFFLDATNTITYHNKQWKCEYNNRQFNVEKYGNTYADDYQLEDIFNWCTEYLQQNVNEDITGVEIYSDVIYNSYMHKFSVTEFKVNKHYDNFFSLTWDTKKVFTKSDVKVILNTLSEKNKLAIFCTVDKVSKYINTSNDIELANANYYSVSKDILNDLKSKKISNNALVVLIEKNNYKRCNFGFILSDYCYSYDKEHDTSYIYDWDLKG